MEELERVFKEISELPPQAVAARSPVQSAPAVPQPTPAAPAPLPQSTMPAAAAPLREHPPVSAPTAPLPQPPIPAAEEVQVPRAAAAPPAESSIRVPIRREVPGAAMPQPVKKPPLPAREPAMPQAASPAPAIPSAFPQSAKTSKLAPQPLAGASRVSGDLDTSDVTAGLERLLSEWKLFRGSGMFGTGAGGTDHPLFKRLAPMPMSIVATGSWDSARREEILSIRDYINGWLHEQAITYMPTETFEHYLRRVVKKILDRQGA
jgi:hypothetical protein